MINYNYNLNFYKSQLLRNVKADLVLKTLVMKEYTLFYK